MAARAVVVLVAEARAVEALVAVAMEEEATVGAALGDLQAVAAAGRAAGKVAEMAEEEMAAGGKGGSRVDGLVLGAEESAELEAMGVATAAQEAAGCTEPSRRQRAGCVRRDWDPFRCR